MNVQYCLFNRNIISFEDAVEKKQCKIMTESMLVNNKTWNIFFLIDIFTFG